MGLIEQKHPQYWVKDTVGIIRDIKLATGVFSASESARSAYETRALQVLNQDPSVWANLRNDIFASKDSVVNGHTTDISKLNGVDLTNLEYHRLLAIREKLVQDPQATLTAVGTSIDIVFSVHGISANDIQTIETRVSETVDMNFDTQLQNVRDTMGHVGFVFFLEWCITTDKCINQVIAIARSKKAEYTHLKQSSFEYWNFHNIERLAETKKKLLSKEVWENSRAFILSGWAGNTLAWLWVIQSYLQSGGTISAISGTSMGGALAAIVWSIGNDVNRITELMHDLQNGFQVDGKHHSITEYNLYIPWVPILAKAFIERIMKKYGVEKHTRFSDLKIPVVINAGRQYKKWEQEILLAGWDLVHDSILASMNVPLPLVSNFGWLGRTKIDGVAMIDYAANERGNPTHWIESLGISEKDMIVVDSGYSSETWKESYWTVTRERFLRATQRDFFAKLRIFLKEWMIIDIDPELAWEWGGWKMNPKRTQNLYKLGNVAYNEWNSDKK